MATAALSERTLPKEAFQGSPVKAITEESRSAKGSAVAPGGGSARSRSTSAGSSSGSPGSAGVAGEAAPCWASAQDWKPSVVLERMLAASFVEPPPGLEGFSHAQTPCLGAITTTEICPEETAQSVRQRPAPPPPPAAPPVLAPGLSSCWQTGQAPPPTHMALTQPPAWAIALEGMSPEVQKPALVLPPPPPPPPPPRAQPVVGSKSCPTVGSAGHQLGLCKPCAFFYTKGCQGGTSCVFCHLCPPGEKKRRQKARHQTIKAQVGQVYLAPR